eukprot:TRINITY_DN4165_c0_g1_i1.p2 TRINITY_DN4165_c0_g1~~TRINITY_DN4165_c0_g1_i1.p2  ORF type:complete len:230 (+),score=41.86 TRINITY_DN4165_c0_g1_i1:753-1442(+)
MIKLLATIVLIISLQTIATSRSQQSTPDVTYPYSTTLLRTHHFADNKTFLSIGEELSARLNADGGVEEVYYIFPGWPFDMRDAAHTMALGIRAILSYSYDQTSMEEWYFITDTNGIEKCVAHKIIPLQPLNMKYQGTETIRGINTQVFQSTGSKSVTTQYFTEDVNGPIMFRQHVLLPPGGPEIEWMLDHGTHFTREETAWFNKTGCNEVETSGYDLLKSSPYVPRYWF